MRISILGANGQLGRDLTEALAGHEVRALDSQGFRRDRSCARESGLVRIRPEMIVNLTAYHRVDDCEAIPELAYGVNTLAV